MGVNRLNPEYLVSAVLSLSPILNESARAGILSENYLKARICSQCPQEILHNYGISPHPIHKDSEALNNAVNDMVGRGLLSRSTGTDAIRWVFPISQKEYYQDNVVPNIPQDKVSQLENFARSLN